MNLQPEVLHLCPSLPAVCREKMRRWLSLPALPEDNQFTVYIGMSSYMYK